MATGSYYKSSSNKPKLKAVNWKELWNTTLPPGSTKPVKITETIMPDPDHIQNQS